MTTEALCWLRQFDKRQVCLGKSERCHLVPKRLLLRLGLATHAWDRDLLVLGCAFHHKRFDDGCFTIPEADLPVSFGEAVVNLSRLLDGGGRRELNAWLWRKYGEVPGTPDAVA